VSKTKWLISILLMSLVYGLWAGEAECNIILKTVVVNPSKTKTQTALLKAYLPKEAKPEDIVDLGDLTVDYDITNALYYVYKEFELAPGESVNRSIEIKDIWVISKAEIDALTSQAKKLVEKLKKTAYFDTAITLQKDIESKTSKVLDKQEKALNALPQTHIAVYRENVETLDSIKTILTKLEGMPIKAKVSSIPTAGVGKRISVKVTWWVIVAVIISLGLLSLVFFIIWHRQAGIGRAEEKREEKTE
jgi:hypothetical protein